MTVDKTGRKLKIGQTVDIMLMGVFQCKVIGIKEQPIILSPKQQLTPHLVLACSITPGIRPDGIVNDVYIIADADPKDPLVIENEGKSKLIKPS